MNYSIIKNREELEQFIEWLPDGKFYVSLYARKKYNTNFVKSVNVKYLGIYKES